MRIGRLFGIDIIIHVSWIFIFALVAWALGSENGPIHLVDMSPAVRGAIGVVAALLFFASVLAHELAHSVLARLRGIPVKSITLFIFGGVSSLESDPTNPTAEGWISFVGPLSSLIIAGIFEALAFALGMTSALGAVAHYLAYANAMLAAFNIVPAQPLDGGRVLHAIIWGRTGDRLRATRIAAGIGKVIAGLIIAAGVFESLVSGFGAGLWVIFIGWFILQAGGAELAQAEANSALAGMTALELAAPVGVTVAAGDRASKALETLLRFGVREAPVVLDGRLLGVISVEALAAVAEGERENTPVTAVMTRIDALKTLSPEDKAVDAVRLVRTGAQGLIPVIDDAGALRGVITPDAVRRRIDVTRTVRHAT